MTGYPLTKATPPGLSLRAACPPHNLIISSRVTHSHLCFSLKRPSRGQSLRFLQSLLTRFAGKNGARKCKPGHSYYSYTICRAAAVQQQQHEYGKISAFTRGCIWTTPTIRSHHRVTMTSLYSHSHYSIVYGSERW